MSPHVAVLGKELGLGGPGSARPSRPRRPGPQAWRKAAAPLRPAPGIGDATARALLAEPPGLGAIGRHRLAALVGAAPASRGSGLARGRRAIAAGRASLRCVPYMAALAAIRRRSPPKPFHDRLTARGRPKKVAPAAVLRRLPTTLDAIARDRRPWEPPNA